MHGQTLRREYTAAWIALLAVTTAVEVKAILDKSDGRPGGTISEHLRASLGLYGDSHRVHRTVGIVGLVAASSWFIPHLVLGDRHE